MVGRPGERHPLILDRRGRLYLYRYWGYEQELADDLLQRADAVSAEIDEARLRAIYDNAPDRFRGASLFEAAHILFPAAPGDTEARSAARVVSSRVPGTRTSRAPQAVICTHFPEEV